MKDPIELTLEQLLPVLISLERRRRAAQNSPHLMPPLPNCPACSTDPIEIIDSVDDGIERRARIHFRPCGHRFTAVEDVILEAWNATHSLLRQQENRPAGLRADAPCPKVDAGEPHDAHDWYAQVDGPARCPGYEVPDATPQEARDPNPSITAKLFAPKDAAPDGRPLVHLYEVRTVTGALYCAQADDVTQDLDWLTLWAAEAITLRIPAMDLRALRRMDPEELASEACDIDTAPEQDDGIVCGERPGCDGQCCARVPSADELGADGLTEVERLRKGVAHVRAILARLDDPTSDDLYGISSDERRGYLSAMSQVRQALDGEADRG